MLRQSTCKLLSTLFVHISCIYIHHTKPALNNTANTAGVNKTGERKSKVHLKTYPLKSQRYIKPASLIHIKVGLLAIKKNFTTVGISRGGLYDCD